MSRPRGTGNYGESNKHPYLRNAYYEELFGHLEKSTSTRDWLNRMSKQREIIRKSKRMDGINLAKLHS